MLIGGQAGKLSASRPPASAARSLRGRQHFECLPESLVLPVAALLCLSLSTLAWADLGKLVRQQIRRTASGDSVLVCVYVIGNHDVERTYPLGNFCPKYAEE